MPVHRTWLLVCYFNLRHTPCARKKRCTRAMRSFSYFVENVLTLSIKRDLRQGAYAAHKTVTANKNTSHLAANFLTSINSLYRM